METKEEAVFITQNGVYVPADKFTYRQMLKLNFPSTKIGEQAMPLLIDGLKRMGLQVRGRKLQPLQNAVLTRISSQWMREKGFKATVTSKDITLRTTSSDVKTRAERIIPKVEAELQKFFVRWGYQFEIQITESAGKYKLYCEFKFSNTKRAVVVLAVPPVEDTKAVLEMGTHRLMMNQDDRLTYWWLEAKCGSEWKQIVRSSVYTKDITDPTRIIGLLINSLNTN